MWTGLRRTKGKKQVELVGAEAKKEIQTGEEEGAGWS